MPVILEPKNYERWLAPADAARLPVDLLKPYPTEEMKTWKVGKAVGNTRNDYPGPIEPVQDEESGPPLALFE